MCFCVLPPESIGASSEEIIINDIIEKCSLIDSAKSYRKVEKDSDKETTEGGVIIAYFDGNKLKKIVEELYAETGKQIVAYYIWEGKPTFVLETVIKYAYPINFEHPLSGEEDTIEESRFYLNNGLLVKWTKAIKKEYHKDSEQYIEAEKNVLKEANNLINKFKGETINKK